ncbi:MAG TPA: hypothetical protein VE442_26175 [Jatrophihabitans sp.]|nr:hypothetical protein [Jatrophihabitans sp.]
MSAVIDILDAIESVVEAAIARHTRRCGERVAASAIALAVPAARQPGAAAAMLEQLRADPAGTARAFDCTLGAVLVWRAVDRAERAGHGALDSAEAGLRAALAYLELAPGSQLTGLGVDQPAQCAALAVLEVQARLALSQRMEETA